MKRVLATLSVIAALTGAAIATSMNMASGAPPTVSASPTTYTAVAPCRLFDTRVHNSPIPAGSTRTLVVGGTADFPAQGGSSGGCGIPTTATAVTVSLSAVIPAGPGYLRAWPAGTTPPTATVLNYTKGFNITTGATIPVSSTGMTVEAFASKTGLVIDVTGYYQGTISASVDSTGALTSGNGILDTSRLGVGDYVITTDRDVSNCTASVSSPDGTLSNATTSGNQITVHLVSLSGLTNTDDDFNVGVLC
jgi:hypothetical protein